MVNRGTAAPLILILKVRSLILPKLSVARIVNVVVTVCVTSTGIPLSIPVVEFNIILAGNDPANNVYVTEVAGVTGDADNGNVIITPYGNVPIVPAGVLQIGCAILTLQVMHRYFIVMFSIF